ncbi:hypothetical protein HDV00_011524, partial [Rhizophlyctis rosea]
WVVVDGKTEKNPEVWQIIRKQWQEWDQFDCIPLYKGFPATTSPTTEAKIHEKVEPTTRLQERVRELDKDGDVGMSGESNSEGEGEGSQEEQSEGSMSGEGSENEDEEAFMLQDQARDDKEKGAYFVEGRFYVLEQEANCKGRPHFKVDLLSWTEMEQVLSEEGHLLRCSRMSWSEGKSGDKGRRSWSFEIDGKHVGPVNKIRGTDVHEAENSVIRANKSKKGVWGDGEFGNHEKGPESGKPGVKRKRFRSLDFGKSR